MAATSLHSDKDIPDDFESLLQIQARNRLNAAQLALYTEQFRPINELI